MFFSALVFILFGISEVQAEGDKPYISQEFVDTMVQNAYYNFVAAAEFTGSDLKQSNAIAHAKVIVKKLKGLAKGDPNRRYVLWKVGELEQQIFLEEEELFLRKMYKNQKAINVLVGKFNIEVGKWRPGFANLNAINSRMLNLSERKANELEWLIKDRNRNISREVSYSLEKALVAGNYDKAKKEFDYVRKNRKFLLISDKKYDSFERRIRAKLEADDMIANIGKYVNEIRAIINRIDIADARYNIECLQNRVKEVRSLIPYRKHSRFNLQISDLKKALTHKEDSLVNENLELVYAKRSGTAIDYLNNVLRKQGVSIDKIVMVDKTILEMPGQRGNVVDSSVDRELIAFANTSTQERGFNFGDVRAKAKAKADSIRAYKEEQARLAQIKWEKEHRREINARKRAEKKLQRNKEKAEIYTLRKSRLATVNPPRS